MQLNSVKKKSVIIVVTNDLVPHDTKSSATTLMTKMPWFSHYQGSFCKYAQPMRDDVTSLRRLSLAGRIYKIIPALPSAVVMDIDHHPAQQLPSSQLTSYHYHYGVRQSPLPFMESGNDHYHECYSLLSCYEEIRVHDMIQMVDFLWSLV